MKNIKINYLLLALIVLSISLSSCRKDDGINTGIEEEPRDVQQLKDADTLLTYINSHYYNSGDFLGTTNPSMYDLEITKLAAGESFPVDPTLFADVVEERTTSFS